MNCEQCGLASLEVELLGNLRGLHGRRILDFGPTARRDKSCPSSLLILQNFEDLFGVIHSLPYPQASQIMLIFHYPAVVLVDFKGFIARALGWT